MNDRKNILGGACTLVLVASTWAYGCGSDETSKNVPDEYPGSGGDSASGGAGEPDVGGEAAAGGGGSVDCSKWGPITEDTVWEPLSACPDGFDVELNVEVEGSGTVLTIEPGTKLKFGAEAGLNIQASAALLAVGTEEEPIVFTGWQELEGSWEGIVFYSNAVSNEISHAIVEYAGAPSGASGNLVLSSDGPGRIKLSSTILRHSAKFGLAVLDGGAFGEFSDNSIVDNLGGAIRVAVTSVDQLAGEGNTIEDNGNDNSVRIESSILHKLLSDVTWPNLSPAIYRVTDDGGDAGAQIYVAAHLTLEPGTIIEFNGGSGVDVSDGTAGLSAVGTEEAPIIFRGVDGSGWTGIAYCESSWSGNALEYVEIHNAKGPPDAWSYCGTGSSSVLRPSVLVGHNFSANASSLRIKNLVFAGPNNAAADIGVKAPSELIQEGTNLGTGTAGALVLEEF